MKVHSNDYKENIKEMGRQVSSILIYSGAVLQQELYHANINYEGNILKSVMKKLEIESSVDIPVDTEVNFQFGIYTGEDYEFLDYGQYIVVKSEKKEDAKTYNIECYDKLIWSMKPYENMGITYPITVRDYINAICTHLNIGFANIGGTFANWNKVIPNEKYLDASGNDIGYTFRDVLDELAQVTGSTICINANDELEIRYITNSLDTIDENYLKDVNVTFGEKYGPINSIVLSRSGNADNVYIQDSQSIEQNGLCEIKISDNQIMNDNNRSEYLPDLLSRLGGLEYYINDFSSTGICYYDLCDRYGIQVGEQTYSCVMFNDEIDISQGIEENIYTNMPEQSETDYSKSDKTDQKINQTYFIVDKQNQVIESVVSNVNVQNNKISQISQTVDELNSKISDIADITISGETDYAILQLDNINDSEPIEIKIHPVADSISYLYPTSRLYPSSNVFPKVRTLRFINESTSEIIDYVLPDNLLYYDSQHYDEFYLNYDSQTCQVTKRCGYDANGNIVVLASEVVTDYPYPLIHLSDGDYTIELLGYEYGYLNVRLMAQNIYTTQFATKAEMTSAINQKANEISLVVNEKLDEEDFTHASIVARINDDTSQIQIEADKIDLNATDVIDILAGNTLNLTSKAIAIDSNNFKVTTNGNVTASGLTATSANISGTITGSNINGSNINGGRINLQASYRYSTTPAVKIVSTDTYNDKIEAHFFNDRIAIFNSSPEGPPMITINNTPNYIGIVVENSSYVTSEIEPTKITSPLFVQTSLASEKKNFEKVEYSAIDIIKDIDIYRYNLKFEEDTDKKHFGFVIGDNFRYSKEITNNDNTKVDNYSFISICCKAIQEQQEQIEELKKEINKLKGEK